jgi:hypothetical protein
MKNTYIQLTSEQTDALSGVFDDLDKEVEGGKVAAVIAQVFPDGMRVTVLSGELFEKTAALLGGNQTAGARTLAEHINNVRGPRYDC